MSINRWTKKMCSIFTMAFYLAIQKLKIAGKFHFLDIKSLENVAAFERLLKKRKLL